jgi:hypothetical protein
MLAVNEYLESIRPPVNVERDARFDAPEAEAGNG